jgi:tRNA-specific 2-thiouridylase
LAERREQSLDERGVLVGLSGGVDSAVAALLLKEQGYRVVGVTLRLWSDSASQDRRTGCSAEALDRAKRVADQVGIPHRVVDAEEAFYRGVVQYFVKEYERGRTPNPCVKCNSRVRFGLLLQIARELGLARMATGHYARLIGEPPGLARGADRGKDQSYVLAEVAPEVLRRCLFPLGPMTKAEVRALAARAGLESHSAPESQEICFIPDDDHRRFLRERLGERPGAIVDGEGRKVGRHSGTYNFTIGQRKGLGIAAEEALYVVRLSAERQEVVVGPGADLAAGRINLDEGICHRTGPAQHPTVQWRSTGGAVRARVTAPGTVVLEEPAVGVSPGQTAVLYEGEMVLMAATIRSSEPWTGVQQEARDGGSNRACGIFVRSSARQKGA